MIANSDILIKPIMSEKSNQLSEQLNKYVFQVEKQCNKLEIKGAIEEKFNVKIKKVATMNFKGKNKRSNWNRSYD